MSKAMPGRNEPCPCGSGVKFKRCCGLDDRWVPRLGWIPSFARRSTTDGRMIDDAAGDPALLESPVWKRFCGAERAAERGDLAVAVTEWEALYFESERHPWIEYIEVADSVAQHYVGLQRWDSAIEWLERVVVMRQEVHGEVDAWSARRDIADVLIRAGRTDEAKEIYEKNRVATPDDIWLYNGAALGWLYSGHDGAAALPWIEEAIAVAERTGDPERLLDQLEHLRREAMGD